MELQANFSANVKMYRTLRHKTLEEFSAELSIGKTTLQEIERGTSNPTLETINRVAEALDVSPLGLLAECYDPADYHAAHALLPALDAFQRLSIEAQQKAESLLSQLLIVLRPAFEVEDEC